MQTRLSGHHFEGAVLRKSRKCHLHTRETNSGGGGRRRLSGRAKKCREERDVFPGVPEASRRDSCEPHSDAAPFLQLHPKGHLTFPPAPLAPVTPVQSHLFLQHHLGKGFFAGNPATKHSQYTLASESDPTPAAPTLWLHPSHPSKDGV